LRTRGGWHALLSQDVTHLLVLLDPLRVAKDALDLALNFAKDRWARVTLMHGGRLVHPLATDNQAARAEDRDGLFDLICLYWQIKNRYENVTISHQVPRSAQQVLSEAAESSIDLIVLPEALFEPFEHLLLVEGGREVLRSSQCPIVIITAAAINSTKAPISDISWFR
jgi:nucleotide-binding universal stress UspA family protein